MDSPALLQLDQQLCFSLYRASRAMTQAYGPLLRRLGLTYPQYLVLLVLWDEGAAGVSRLGERLQLDSGTLTPLLQRLERRGLLLRERSRADQRRLEVKLTAAGRRLRERACPIPEEMLRRSGLAPAAAVRLRAQMNSLTRALLSAQAPERKSA
jgi:DNA-binding MarR family transcriptional regulator